MQISDDIRLGSVFLPNAGFLSDGNPSPMERGVGPMGRVFVWDVVPAALAANNIAPSQNPASGGSFALTAAAGVTRVTLPDGSFGYVLDVPRAVRIVAAGANTATYRVNGFDQYGQAMSQDLAAPSTSTVTTLKAFSIVISVVNLNATAGTNNLTVGTTDVLGVPVRVTDRAYMATVKWDNTLADNAGTLTPADVISPATRATGDVRGTFLLSSASNGTRRLVAVIALPSLAVSPTATRIDAAGVDQL